MAMDETQKSYENEIQEQENEPNLEKVVTFAEDDKEAEDDNSSPSSSRGSATETPVTLPQFQYSKDELMQISKAPLAKKWPDFLDQAFTKYDFVKSSPERSTGTWDPEKWFKSKRRSESPQVDDLRSKRERPVEFERSEGIGAFKRRTPDPKERIKEERDDIVLSPQRRSFGTGCHVAQTFTHRPGSPLDSRESDSIHREPSRRIGSGRIVRDQRDWDKDHKDYGYGGGRNRFDRDEKENRYGNSGGRYRTNDRRMGRGRSDDRIDEEEEPEWFSSGPTSQSEFIELVGFEDEKKKCMLDRPPIRRTKDYFSRNKIVEESPKEVENVPLEEPAPPPPQPPPQPKHEQPPLEAAPKKSQDFDVNDIFKMDWFLPNGTPPEPSSGQGGLGGSRFSQWFSRGESPTSKMMAMGQQPLSYQDDFSAAEHIFRSGMGGQMQQQHHHQVNNFFAPSGGEKNIMEILQNANMNCGSLVNHDSHLKEQAMSGKVKCVEELEANLKLLVLGNKKQPMDGEKSAFNKLVSHLTDSHHSPSPPASISMGPMDKSKVLQEEDLIQNLYMDSSPPVPPSIPMPDVRISPTPTLPPAGSMRSGTTLMDFLKNTEKQPMMAPPNVMKTQLQQQQQQQHHQQQQNTLADLMRTWSGGQVQNNNDLLARLVHNQPIGGNVSPRLIVAPNASELQNVRPNPVVSSANLTAMLQQRELLVAMAKDQHLRPTPSPEPLCRLSPQHSPLPQECPTMSTRIPSPLVFGQQPPVLSHAPSPIHPTQVTHGNTLQVQSSPVLPRVPSPQELAAHTQTILHNALIKRKLEEQRENYLKRQEALRPRSPNPQGVSMPKSNPPVSPAKTINSTLAAFTPTSVMRKMYSDKYDKDGIRTDLQNSTGGNRLQVSPDLKVPCEPLHQSNGGLNLLHLDTSPSRPIPRALHGQGSLLQRQGPNPMGPGIQGRPIVKGSSSSDPSRAPKAVGPPLPMQHTKQQFSAPNPQAPHLRPDMDSVVRLLNQQQAALAAQRTLNASPMPPMNAGGFPLGPRTHPNLLRPGMAPPLAPANNNLNLPLLRSMVQANFNNPALRGLHQLDSQSAPLNQLTQLSQLAALQQQQQQQQQHHQQQQQQQQQQNRGGLDPRQLRNLHPLALQQFLLNVQSQASGVLPLNNNVANMPGVNRMDGTFAGAQGMKTLMPPCQPNTSRQSPVNLARWFGNDVLKQKMPDMPPVPHQKALLVEEVERQQQQSVHN